jgi:hypothetical protein
VRSRRRVLSLAASALLGLATACDLAAAAPQSQSAHNAAAAPMPEPPASTPPPPEDVAPVIVPRPLVTPVTAEMVQAMRAIIARNPDLAADVFAKMGGSSVVNRGFLHCFDPREGEVNLAGRDALLPTLEFFRAGRVNTKSPFNRTSLAAAVGWSLRQGMSGRPSYVAQELRATRARWGLAFFGSNDVMGRNAHQFLGRLDRLADLMSREGVVPVLGATYPRVARDAVMNEQVRRYNRLSSALAQAMGLPYVDFHQAMLPLPVRGLAADGYHPNTYTVGPRSLGCDFTEAGLRYGNNQRNLLTLTALDALRRTLVAGEPPAPSAVVSQGAGTRASPVRVRALPYAARLPVTAFAEPSGGSICANAGRQGPRQVVRVRMDADTRVRISAVQMGDLEMHIEVVRPDGTCAGSGTDDEVLTLPPGVTEIAVIAVTPARAPAEPSGTEPRTLFVLDVEP